MTWESPAIETLGDAVVVVEVVAGSSDGGRPRQTSPGGPRTGQAALRLAHANRNAEKVFELGQPSGPAPGPRRRSRSPGSVTSGGSSQWPTVATRTAG